MNGSTRSRKILATGRHVASIRSRIWVFVTVVQSIHNKHMYLLLSIHCQRLVPTEFFTSPIIGVSQTGARTQASSDAQHPTRLSSRRNSATQPLHSPRFRQPIRIRDTSTPTTTLRSHHPAVLVRGATSSSGPASVSQASDTKYHVCRNTLNLYLHTHRPHTPC